MMLGGEGGQAGVREVPELYNKGGGCSSLRPGTVKGSRLAGGKAFVLGHGRMEGTV